MDWARSASQQFGIPVLAAIKTLRVAGGNFQAAEAKLRETQEGGAELVWTAAEDRLLTSGSKADLSDLTAKFGPMEIVKRMTALRD